MKKYPLAVSALLGLASFALAGAAAAQVTVTNTGSVGSSVSAPAGVSGSADGSFRSRLGARFASTSANFSDRASTTEARMAERMTGIETHSDTAILGRIASLNQALARVNAMTKISASEKAGFSSSLQTEIASMNSLKTSISSDTSTTSMKADAESITKSYRIYALILPQTDIAASVDRILDIAGELNTVAAKISSYNASGSASASASTLADLSAKTSDATTNANAALSETVSLQPDQGDQATLTSNTAALKDARTKIQTATADLVAARKDAGTAAATVKANANVSASASTTTQ